MFYGKGKRVDVYGQRSPVVSVNWFTFLGNYLACLEVNLVSLGTILLSWGIITPSWGTITPSWGVFQRPGELVPFLGKFQAFWGGFSSTGAAFRWLLGIRDGQMMSGKQFELNNIWIFYRQC
jgi:hypothetical protein